MSAIHELQDAPSDSISSLAFSPSGTKLVVASWDSSITIYTRSSESETPFALESTYETRAPVLDVCLGKDDNSLYCVGLDGDVRDMSQAVTGGEERVLSSHSKESNKVVYSKNHNLILSTSWDGSMHAHNVDNGAFIRIQLPAKPFALAVTAERVVVAMAERKVSVYDLGGISALISRSASSDPNQAFTSVPVWQERESSLKFMTRAIACMPNNKGFAVSSIEGRVGVEWFDPEAQKDMYAFKCHRQTTKARLQGQDTEEEIDVVYPVNALAFHPVHGTFATGGGDGVVALWDANTKRRVRQYPKLGASVAAVDFSNDGKFLAIAVSPGFEDGEEKPEGLDTPGSVIKVVIRTLSELEAKGKAAK
ncbi:putative nuclear pore complex subunit [Acrodontium crateriforme]|uniref:Nuclear pore complex subunit n=1 Tax=Acrodontium crateriforme TaxID=150365 RepID=A0AAQ3RAQ7_9PEZI|nr:putative nuclear pore complex subunit [Acrodontium crateriforme]